MTEKIFDAIKNEFKISLTKKNHPYRLATLGTVGLDHMARLRTIVVRDISKDLTVTFYTDKRSKKVTHIQENNKVSLLFYNPEKSIQLKIEGIAVLIKNPDILEEHWRNISERSKKDYISSKAPGTEITGTETIEYINESHHFCMIAIAPKKIEYLKLNTDKHFRIRYSLSHENWNGIFLVP